MITFFHQIPRIICREQSHCTKQQLPQRDGAVCSLLSGATFAKGNPNKLKSGQTCCD